MLTELTHNDLVIIIIAQSVLTFLWAYLCGLSWKCDSGENVFLSHFLGMVGYAILDAALIWGGLYWLLVNG